MTPVQGWAAASDAGKILLLTVSDTPRGAMVNWLISEALVMVTRDATDRHIAAAFEEYAAKLGARLIPVTVSLARPS